MDLVDWAEWVFAGWAAGEVELSESAGFSGISGFSGFSGFSGAIEAVAGDWLARLACLANPPCTLGPSSLTRSVRFPRLSRFSEISC